LSGKSIISLCGSFRIKTNKLNRGINEGRQCAREVDQYLMKNTQLPVTGGIVKPISIESLVKSNTTTAPATITVTAA
jgi:hypothetical protein